MVNFLLWLVGWNKTVWLMNNVGEFSKTYAFNHPKGLVAYKSPQFQDILLSLQSDGNAFETDWKNRALPASSVYRWAYKKKDLIKLIQDAKIDELEAVLDGRRRMF